MSKKYYIIGGVILFLIIVIIGALVFSKKPSTQQGNIELTWWKTFETTENVEQLISDYEQLHKNVTINYVKKDVNTYQQDLLNAFASGTAPDILSIHNDWLPQQIDRLAPAPQTIIPIRNYQSTFVDVASDDFVKDNQVYAVPMSIDLLALYYNKDILNAAGIIPPTTWDQVVQDVQKITKLNKPSDFVRSGIALGVSANVNRAVDIMSLLMLQNGTQFYNPDKSLATFDQQQTDSSNQTYNPGASALQYLTQFANPSSAAYTWNAKSDNNIDAFTQGKVGMILTYYYMLPQIKDKAPTLGFGVVPVPQISTNSVKVNFANYWGEAVSKNSKNSAVAWDFLNFITSQQELTKYYAQHKQISSRKDILESQVADPEIGVYAENALSAKSVYKVDPDGFERVISQMIDDVSLRSLSSEQALTNAAQQINLQLQK